jgi:hypothetical protein
MTEGKMARGVIRTTVVTATAVACLIGVQTSGATFRGVNGLLVYQAQASKHIQLFTIRPEGTGRRQITFATATPRSRRGRRTAGGSFSPATTRSEHSTSISTSSRSTLSDDKRIAFVSNRGGSAYQICVMNADGTHATALTHTAAGGHLAAWGTNP